MRLPFALSLALVFIPAAFSAPALKEAAGKDLKLIGDWVLVSLEQGGKPVAIEGLAGRTEFTEDGRRITRNRSGAALAERLYTLGRDRVPSRIDIRAKDGEAVALRGVYSINADKLTICYVTDDAADRPTKLESPAGSKVFLAVYKRAPKVERPDE